MFNKPTLKILSPIDIFTTDTDTPFFLGAVKQQHTWKSANRFSLTPN